MSLLSNYQATVTQLLQPLISGYTEKLISDQEILNIEQKYFTIYLAKQWWEDGDNILYYSVQPSLLDIDTAVAQEKQWYADFISPAWEADFIYEGQRVRILSPGDVDAQVFCGNIVLRILYHPHSLEPHQKLIAHLATFFNELYKQYQFSS